METMKDIRDAFKKRGEELQRQSTIFMGISQELFQYGVTGFDEEREFGGGLEPAFEGEDEASILRAMKDFERGVLVGQYTLSCFESIQYANQS